MTTGRGGRRVRGVGREHGEEGLGGVAAPQPLEGLVAQHVLEEVLFGVEVDLVSLVVEVLQLGAAYVAEPSVPSFRDALRVVAVEVLAEVGGPVARVLDPGCEGVGLLARGEELLVVRAVVLVYARVVRVLAAQA